MHHSRVELGWASAHPTSVRPFPSRREPEQRRWEAEPRRVQGAWVEWGEDDEVVEVDLGQAPMGPPMRPQQSRQQQQQAPREPALPRSVCGRKGVEKAGRAGSCAGGCRLEECSW